MNQSLACCLDDGEKATGSLFFFAMSQAIGTRVLANAILLT